MAAIHKILVPIDFSDACANATRYAQALATRLGASMTLLHAVQPVDFEFAMAQPTRSRYLQLAGNRNKLVRHAITTFPSDPSLEGDVERIVVQGDASDEILRIVREQQFDMILMPTRGGGPLQRWLLIGSVTVKVLHDAECPVLAGIDFSHAGSPLAIQHVLCAIDLGPHSAKVLCWGAGLSRELGARLTVVHAAAGEGEAAKDYVDESWRVTLRSRLREQIVKMQNDAGIEADIIVETGDPHKVVARTARRLHTGLVVIGRGTSGDIVGRLRAHAYEIIRLSPCPVVSI